MIVQRSFEVFITCECFLIGVRVELVRTQSRVRICIDTDLNFLVP